MKLAMGILFLIMACIFTVLAFIFSKPMVLVGIPCQLIGGVGLIYSHFKRIALQRELDECIKKEK